MLSPFKNLIVPRQRRDTLACQRKPEAPPSAREPAGCFRTVCRIVLRPIFGVISSLTERIDIKQSNWA
jgi:hypothetical protein